MVAFGLIVPASAAGWTTLKNEADPFEPSKSTIIATTMNGVQGLGIRCLEGNISLVLITAASNATAGDSSELKIVADGMPVREEDNAQVMSATNFSTAIQFGDEDTLGYLKGAKKISVRYAAGASTSTESFSGGKSLDDVIAKALKACGKMPSETSKIPTSDDSPVSDRPLQEQV